jgi:glycosyltransferase involved in cell wall biosynthesis
MFPHIAGQIATLLTRPGRYLQGLATAWQFEEFSLKRFLLATAYFLEAITTGQRLQKAGIRYVHSVYSTTVARILAKVFDINLSMTLHGSAEFMDPKSFALAEKVRASQRICSISYFGKSQIMLSSSRSDWHKLRVTPLGVNLRGRGQRPFRANPKPFRLISIGRLVETKGCPLLLSAIASLKIEGRDIHLTLVGDGPLRQGLEQHVMDLGIDDCVSFAGWCSQENLQTLLAQSDACVLASFAEGVPVVLMEAMAVGVPCIAPRINGIPELIRDGIDGRLFTPSNVGELVASIREITSDSRLRRAMTNASRERIGEKYDFAKNTKSLSDMFQEWISQPSEEAREYPEIRPQAA